MKQLIGLVPLSSAMRRHYSAYASRILSSASARPKMHIIRSALPVRHYSSKKDNEKKNDEHKEVVKEQEDEHLVEDVEASTLKSSQRALLRNRQDDNEGEHDEDVFDDEDDLDMPASGEKALVRASVPENIPELIAIPIDRRPVFPGFYKTFTVKDEKVAGALVRALKRGRPYVGLFLAKDRAPQEGDGEASLESSDRVRSLDEIHPVGTFAQLVNVIPGPGGISEGGVTAIVLPHRRIRALQLLPSASGSDVSRVRVENVPLRPHAKQSPVLQALMQEIFVMLSEVARLNPFFREHITHHNVSASIFEEPGRLADFCAVLTSGQAGELQEVLEAEEAEDRLRKALILLKKELMAAELQSTIRKEVEAKLSKKQREYLLHEQLKTIKKELGLESDTKERLTETFRTRAEALTMPPEVRRVFDEVPFCICSTSPN